MVDRKALPRVVRDALDVLAHQVRLARHDRGWTVAELAQRAGVSNRTILAIESGAAGTAIGTVLDVAYLVGVPIFGVEDRTELARLRRQGEQVLALIPSRTYRPVKDEPDDRF